MGNIEIKNIYKIFIIYWRFIIYINYSSVISLKSIKPADIIKARE